MDFQKNVVYEDRKVGLVERLRAQKLYIQAMGLESSRLDGAPTKPSFINRHGLKGRRTQ